MDKTKMIIAGLLVIIVIQSAGLVWLWQMGPDVAEPKTALVIGASAEIGRNLHPQVVLGGDSDPGKQMYEGLFRYTEGEIFALEPALATSMGEVSEDGLTYTFPLRQGVVFHDGTPFNATAVKHHFDLMSDIAMGTTYIFHRALVNKTEIVDTYTISFVLNYPNVAFRYMLAHVAAMIPSVTASEAAIGEGIPVYDGDLYGTGPYKLVSKITDQEVVLTANMDWWDYTPGETFRIRDLTYVMIPDASTLRLALEMGSIDLTVGLLRESDYPSLQANPALQTYDITTAASARWLGFNMNSSVQPVFSNRLMRQAFAYAINYDVIIDSVYEGDADRLYSYLPAEYPGSIQAAEYEYNPDTALTLIATAGFTAPVSVELYTSASYTAREADMVQVIKEYALAAGFDVTIVTQEIGVYRDQYRNTDLQDVMLWRWRADYPAADNWNTPFMQSAGFGTGNCKATAGDMAEDYPYIDELISEAAGTTDEARFFEILEELQELWAYWLPNIFLYKPKLLQFGDVSLQGVWFGGLQWDVNYHNAYFL